MVTTSQILESSLTVELGILTEAATARLKTLVMRVTTRHMVIKKRINFPTIEEWKSH